MRAALAEFAERGFDGASMRAIGDRAGSDFTLITYHFRNKDTLWRAVATHAFQALQEGWDRAAPPDTSLSQKDRLRLEFRAYFDFLAANPSFHSFMMQAMAGDSDRLSWLVETFLQKVMTRVLPRVAAAQAQSGLAGGDPSLLYYLMLGGASALYSLRKEIVRTTGRDAEDPATSEAYWRIFEAVFFDR